jgi:hypothetical protein
MYINVIKGYELVHRKEWPLGPMKVSFSTARKDLTLAGHLPLRNERFTQAKDAT